MLTLSCSVVAGTAGNDKPYTGGSSSMGLSGNLGCGDLPEDGLLEDGPRSRYMLSKKSSTSELDHEDASSLEESESHSEEELCLCRFVQWLERTVIEEL